MKDAQPEEKKQRNYVRKVAVVASRGITDTTKIIKALDVLFELAGIKPTVMLVGNMPGLEEEVLRRFDCVCIKPYSWYDRSKAFSSTEFFVANRQKIDNADVVVVFRTAEDETVWAEQYANKRARPVTVVKL